MPNEDVHSLGIDMYGIMYANFILYFYSVGDIQWFSQKSAQEMVMYRLQMCLNREKCRSSDSFCNNWKQGSSSLPSLKEFGEICIFSTAVF